MKKLLPILLLAFAFSCSKDAVDPKFCWACAMKSVSTYTPPDPILTPVTVEVNNEVCNMNQTEATAYEKSASSTSSIVTSGITATTVTTTKCTKK